MSQEILDFIKNHGLKQDGTILYESQIERNFEDKAKFKELMAYLVSQDFVIKMPNGQNSYDISLTKTGISLAISGHFKRIYESGLTEERSRREMQSVIDTNNSVRRTNRIQIASAATTFIVIATALWLQYKDYKKDKTETQTTKEQLQQVKHSIDLLEKKNDNLYRELDSLKNSK